MIDVREEATLNTLQSTHIQKHDYSTSIYGVLQYTKVRFFCTCVQIQGTVQSKILQRTNTEYSTEQNFEK